MNHVWGGCSIRVTKQHLCWSHWKTQLANHGTVQFNKYCKILMWSPIYNCSRLNVNSFIALQGSTFTHISYTWVSHVPDSQVYCCFHPYHLYPDSWSKFRWSPVTQSLKNEWKLKVRCHTDIGYTDSWIMDMSNSHPVDQALMRCTSIYTDRQHIKNHFLIRGLKTLICQNLEISSFHNHNTLIYTMYMRK